MKNILKNILLILVLAFGFINFSNTGYAASWETTVKVTEKIPWANCARVDWETLYTCTIQRGFGSVMQVMGNLIKYFTYIAWLCAVLALVIWWIMYSMWWADEAMKTKSKEFMTQALLWIIVLLLSWTILYAIAPWIYK